MGDALGNIIPLASVAVSEPSKAVFVKDRVPLIASLSALAVENIDEICSVPGVDAVYVGPADLSVTLGLPPAPDQDAASFSAAITRILDACRAHGVVPGIAGNQQTAPKRIEQGFRLVEVAADAALLARAAGLALRAVAPDHAADTKSSYL